jgi:hypothetical protein
MKNSFATTLAIVTLLFMFSACNNSNTKTNAVEPTVTEASIYTCPMHPEVQADKPGDCPKCGMPLEKKVAADTTQMQSKSDTMQMH